MCAVGVCVLFTSARTFFVIISDGATYEGISASFVAVRDKFSLPDLNKCCIYIYLWVFWAF